MKLIYERREMNGRDSHYRRVPLVVIFDLDDTLFDTEASVKTLLLPALERHGITAAEIREARLAAHRNNNRSLDIVKYVIERSGLTVWEDVKQEYEQNAKNQEAFFLPGAREVIDKLTVANIPFGIKTYGNPILQAMKRKILALPDTIPFHVIDHRRKGELLAQVYQKDTGTFEIDWLGCAASRVAMFENDPTAFNGLENHIAAGRMIPLWIPTSKDKDKSVPQGVEEIKDLAEGLTRLFAVL